MKTNILHWKILIVLGIVSLLFSCTDNGTEQEEVAPEIKVELVENLHAPNDVIDRQTQTVIEERPFVRFSLRDNAVQEGDDWDLAFKGTTILVNGGSREDGVTRTGNGSVALYTGIFDELDKLPEGLSFEQDSDGGFAIPIGGGNGWYNYNGQTHVISPIAGTVLFIRLNDGGYAKMEILSYYKDSPESPDAFKDQSATYTFRYAILPDAGSDI